jgi:hypothetical protein
MSSFFPTIASASLLDTLRDQNTAPQQVHHVHAAQQQFRSTPRPSCVAAQNVTIDIFMYHYVRPTHRDPAHTVVWNNSITPTDFSTQMAYLETLTNEHRVHLAHFSELKKRETSGCYPHHRIALLTADDGRWDNYNFLFPITKKHDIKFTLGIIYNKVGIE